MSELTGLPIDPMFPGPKMRWLLDRVPAGREVRLGTIDAWLIHCLTGGMVHACDASNAARSQLFDLKRQCWSEELGELFGVPLSVLPEVRDSAGDFGRTLNVPGLPDGVPVRAAIGDSHAALFGHGAFRPGDGKVTFGTGSSVMTTLPEFVSPERGITTTIRLVDRRPRHLRLRGQHPGLGLRPSWMADMLGLPDVQALTDLAATVDSSSVGFVPAFVGLGAPYWHSDARGLFSGITFNAKRADMARAVTDSMAFQVHDVISAMNAQSSAPLGRIFVDGGPSRNLFLMQCVSDLLGHPLIQRDAPEASALGAAYLAGLSLGIWPDLDTVATLSGGGASIARAVPTTRSGSPIGATRLRARPIPVMRKR